MRKMCKGFTENESGAAEIVEAAIIFPIMFVILLFLIYLGNTYFIRAKVESIVMENAVLGANYCADPILETIRQNGSVPSVKDVHVQPYRYILGGMNDVETRIAKKVKDEFEASSSSFFKNMRPQLKTGSGSITKFHNYVLYSTFSVSVDYEVEFPIKILGEATPKLMKVSTCAEVAVNDATEFIRNTDMVLDYFGDSKAFQGVGKAFAKLNEFLSKFA